MWKMMSAAAAVGLMFVLGTPSLSAAAPVQKGVHQQSQDFSARRRSVRHHRHYRHHRHVHRRVVRRPYYGYAPYYRPYYRPYYAYRPYPYYRPYQAYAPVPFLPFGIGFGYGSRYW
jgi:hypothetical protein